MQLSCPGRLLKEEKGFPSLPGYYLHTVWDYTEAREGILGLPICFFIWKVPQAFPLSSPYQAWPKEKTWLQKGQCSLDFLHILHCQPTSTPILHIALGYKRDVPPPPYSHSPQAPACFGPVPHFPPTIASPVTVIFLFHKPIPRG